MRRRIWPVYCCVSTVWSLAVVAQLLWVRVNGTGPYRNWRICGPNAVAAHDGMIEALGRMGSIWLAVGLPLLLLGLFGTIVTYSKLVKRDAVARSTTGAGLALSCIALLAPLWLWPSMNNYPGRMMKWEVLLFAVTLLVQMKIVQGAFVALSGGARRHLGEAET